MWRQELGLTKTCSLDIGALVERLGVPLLPLTELGREAPREAYRLYTSDTARFSAAAVCQGTTPLAIVYHDGHEAVRQRSDIAHECAHLILDHQPSAVFDAVGRREYPERLEAEATWFGASLLVPRAGLISILQRDARLDVAARHFDVSVPLVRYVYNTRGCKRLVPLVVSPERQQDAAIEEHQS
jgi:IrrE N-terminal-like domain